MTSSKNSESKLIYQEVDPRRFQIDSLTDALEKLSGITDFCGVECTDITLQLRHILDIHGAVDQSVIIGITDVAGKIIYVNDLFCEITKYSREELIGQTHRIVKSGYHDRAFFEVMWKTIASGKRWQGEVKNKAKDGSYYWVKTVIVPILNDVGRPIMYISIRSEITEGKKAQERLYQALKEDFRQTVSSLDTIIFKAQKNDDGAVFFSLFSGKLSEKLGFTNESFLNKTLEEVFNAAEPVFLNQYFHKAFVGEKVTYKRKINGRTVFFTLTPIFQNGVVQEIVGNGSDITDLENAHETINHMAYHDVVTNLPNQRLFDIDLEKKLVRAQKGQFSFGVMAIKINGITNVNESFGHDVGEQLLSLVAFDLKNVVETFGVIYRGEGSRFLIITKPIENTEKLQEFAEIIRNEVAKLQQIHHYEIKLTSNIGASSYPECSEDQQQLVKNSYTALNYARYVNRRNYNYYSKEVHDHYEESRLLETALSYAIERNELTLHYQPKVDIRENKVTGMEALVRWNSPELGLISPAKFIPLAEESGLIVSIGEWVLEEACRQNVEWTNLGYTPMKVAVNITPQELQHSSFVAKLKRILAKTGLDPQMLEIEITENSIMSESDESIHVINQIREIGISVAIDDFGTGYSSLSYLKKLPVDILKIDQSFIKDIFHSSGDTQLVLGIIKIAHIFNLKVVAEGVETLDVAEFLKQNDCEEIQGYYYSKPIPPAEFERKFLLMKLPYS